MYKNKIIIFSLLLPIIIILCLSGCQMKHRTGIFQEDIDEAQEYLANKYDKVFETYVKKKDNERFPSRTGSYNAYEDKISITFAYDERREKSKVVTDYSYPKSFVCQCIRGHWEDNYQTEGYEYEINDWFKTNKLNEISKCEVDIGYLYTDIYFDSINDFKRWLLDNKDNQEMHSTSFRVYYEDGNDLSLFSLEHCINIANWLDTVVPIRVKDTVHFEQFQTTEHTVHRFSIIYDDDHQWKVERDDVITIDK